LAGISDLPWPLRWDGLDRVLRGPGRLRSMERHSRDAVGHSRSHALPACPRRGGFPRDIRRRHRLLRVDWRRTFVRFAIPATGDHPGTRLTAIARRDLSV